MKVWRSILFVGLYVAVTLALWWATTRWVPVNVVFYAAMMVAAVAVPLSGALGFLLGLFRQHSGFEILQSLVICLLVGYAMAISVPTVIDRSLSFYILEKLQQRGGAIQEARMGDVFVNEYMQEHQLVGIRLTEQMESGTVSVAQGCVRLTAKGDRLASFSRWFRHHLLPRRRLLMGDYTDRLVDPFAHSESQPDYACP
ncbi:hypothetical protein [Hydrogenophaga sp. 5NK40-0174]|uniref:hypothetical protein n=1 Tax=Hydrogenophaga sp. 5NK40-0174 TaxID=3127649 RepID=UPI003103B3B4